MRTVKCVSPHGGAHHGLRADNELPASPGYRGALVLEANEGGWVWNPLLGHVRVGGEVGAPEPPEFIADGFHFVDATTGTGDVCAAAGDACWCGQHRGAVNLGPGGGSGGIESPPDPADAPVTPVSPLAGLLGKENS